MTVEKSELESGMSVNVEVTTMTSFKSDVFELTIERVDQMFEKPLEFTAKDEKGRKFRAYLDKNKLECTDDLKNGFVGCIGTIVDIWEPKDE